MNRGAFAFPAAITLLGLAFGQLGCNSSQPPSSAAVEVKPGQAVTASEARAIANDAYVYGFPMVDGYRIQYAYSVDRSNP